MSIDRRQFIAAAGSAAALASCPPLARAQSGPIRLGLLTIRTGPLASGGLDIERALQQYLRERGQTIGGRKVELVVADTAGVPATARTKAQELVERNKVHALTGPMAAFEALAIDDYVRQQQVPTLWMPGAEDMTQRKTNPWAVRATATSAQCSHPMGDYCAKVLKYRRMVVIADDLAFGHETVGGFQRAFEDAGGKVVQRLFSPLTVPDYGSYLAQLKTDADAIFIGFAGSNGFRFLRQFNEYGLAGKLPVVGNMTALEESVLRNMGDEALGVLTACWYSAELDNEVNRKFSAAFRAETRYDPGLYAAMGYVNGAVFEAAVTAANGQVEDKAVFMKALREVKLARTARGPVSFDAYGNVVGDVYIRKVVRKEGRLVNSVIDTYPNVSQFWKYEPAAFLKEPVYSRSFPPARHLES
ncbi:ABC transporter substrate-binding protein [Variovorax sp.]|jgi:branched-chain amino acid transport system substrate-binding protein|uniref:ABC transporter substrate-binding protein n=1 Tax=Variovorax sp. TaxID=1871043 RepID=UPI0037DA0F8B